MNYRIKDIPKEERPRERLKEVGAESNKQRTTCNYFKKWY